MLVPLKPAQGWPRFGVYDIETFPDEEVSFCVASTLIDGEVRFHTSPADMLEYMLSSRFRGVVWYAHNGGKFDFRILLPRVCELASHGWAVELLPKNGRIFICKMKKDRQVFTFTDSVEILPSSLADLAKSFDLPVLKGSIDYANISDTPEVRDYCANDCAILDGVLRRFMQSPEALAAGPCYTAASLAMALFRREYLKRNIPALAHDAEEFIRQCLYGGRVEVFERHATDVNFYDVNSMYPSVMLDSVPVGPAIFSRSFRDDRLGFWKADVTVDSGEYVGPLPYRRDDGKLIFPVGRLESCYFSTSEMIEALDAGVIRSIDRVEGFYFPLSSPILRDYSENLYAKKLQAKRDGDVASEYRYKLLLNSLFGKFGQRRERERLVISTDQPDNAEPFDEDLGIWSIPDTSRAAYILPQISATITARARVKIYQALRSTRPIYTDTDSLATRDALETGDQLGAWGFVARIREGWWIAPKLYTYTHAPDSKGNTKKSAHRGIPRRSLDLKEHEIRELDSEIVRAYNGETVEIEWETFDGFKESHKRGGTIHRVKKKRTLSIQDDKRVWSGDLSRPIHLN